MRKQVILHTTFIFIAILFISGCGEDSTLELIKPERGRLLESFTETARTQLNTTYVITMPKSGRIGRIPLEPGDPVKQGEELVKFDRKPFELELTEAKAAVHELEAEIQVNEYNELEETVHIESLAIIRASTEALNASAAQVEAEKRRSERANKELSRLKALAKEQSITESRLDDAELEAETATIELRKQEFYYAALKAMLTAIHLGPIYVDKWLSRKHLQRYILQHKLNQAKARLDTAEYNLNQASILSPIEGVVLEKFEQGGGPFPEGTHLLRIGNLDELEVIADILTQDAIRIKPGSRVLMNASSDSDTFEGEIKRIEPAGFTKLSSLGVEQQRVNVIVTLHQRPENLGVGYQLRAEFITGNKEDALLVPRMSIMQDNSSHYFVWKNEQNKLAKQTVTLGLQSDLQIEIIDGLSENDQIVYHPDATLTEGKSIN